MFNPDDARRFLDHYEEGREFPHFDQGQPPNWLIDRHPWVDPNANPEEQLVPLHEYDVEDRVGELADSDEYVEGTDIVDVLVEEYSGAVDAEGFDALAWYVPFHFSMSEYGIYVTEEGIRLLGTLLYAWSRGHDRPEEVDVTITVRGDSTSIDPSNVTPEYDGAPIDSLAEAYNLALEILLRHEWYHHQTELFATYLEDAAGEMFYPDYHENAYQSTHPGVDCIEESLANAYVERSRACHRRAPSGSSFKTLFKYLTLFQPPGYRTYERFTGDRFRVGGRHLGHLLRTTDPTDISNLIGSPDHQLRLGSKHPMSTSIRGAIRKGRIRAYIVRKPSQPKYLNHFKTIPLETEYSIVRTDDFEKTYKRADGSVCKRVDRSIEKLRKNVEHSGFRWRNCKSGYQYVRINQGMRMIVKRDDPSQTVELIDFSTDHDLPAEYGCYA